jgi:fumarate hydratase class II
MISSAAIKFRMEEDALGDVEVPAEHLWGAQTERSHRNFPIGVEHYRWGRPVIRALGVLKKCAALANGDLGQLARVKVDLIVRAAQEVIDGKLDGEFPLVVFQTGSGTQNQHECQRGDCQSRNTAGRRGHRLEETDSSQ